MSVAIIINPVSGTGWRKDRSRTRAEIAERFLAARGVAGEVLMTAAPGDGFRLAAGAARRGAALVIAWGGDGTVNEVGSAIAFRAARLGIVPAGSGNGLARALGIPRQPAQALATALDGAERPIDAGELGGHLFFNIAGLGFDAEVALMFNASVQRGPLAYGYAILRQLSTYEAATYTFQLDGRTFDRRALFVAVANSTEYGVGARIAPRARLDDGLLNIVVVGERSLWQAASEIRRLFDGSVESVPGVATYTARDGVITADRPIRCHVDGDVVEMRRTLTFRAVPGALRVRIPAS